MTAGRAGRIAVVVALGAGWLALAWRLSATVVPDDLTLPPVDVDTVFGAGLVARAERYERFLDANWALARLVLLAALAAYAWQGARLARRSTAGPLRTGLLLGLLGLAVVWLATLPFSIASLWWDRRHGLSHGGYVHAVLGDWPALAASVVVLSVALAVLMFLARRLGRWWWLPGAFALTAIAAVLLLLEPYVRTGLEPVRDARVGQAFERLARAEGVTGVPLRVEKVSQVTTRANAYAFGLGPSRRIVLWDTLLDGRFTQREVDVLMAHELGHQARDHVAKALGWFLLFALPGAFLVELVTRRRGGLAEPAAVPLALLAVAVLQLAALPAENLISRRMEAEADWTALETTRDPAAARGLFRELAATSLGDPSPPAWTRLLFGTHPTLAQRVAMADAWAQRRGR